MTGSLPTFAGGLLGLGVTGGSEPVGRALKHGFGGVELAVKSLGRAVFEPLASRGRVYAPFQLLLRLDAPDPAVQPALEALLEEHTDLLTRCTGDEVTPGAVTVVLTGRGWDRDRLVGAYERRTFLEGHVDAPCGPPSLVPLVYESLATRLEWDAREPWRELPAEARHIVRALVMQAHAEGRRLRFIDIPERPRAARLGMWRELQAAGVDYLGSQHEAALARFLRGRLGGLRRTSRHAAPRSRYTAGAHPSRTDEQWVNVN
jgi:hypothetical protein